MAIDDDLGYENPVHDSNPPGCPSHIVDTEVGLT
jgi:hypothetical protein